MELPLNLFKSIILNSISKEGEDTNSIQLDNILDWFKNFVSTLSSSALQNIKIMINEAKDKYVNIFIDHFFNPLIHQNKKRLVSYCQKLNS